MASEATAAGAVPARETSAIDPRTWGLREWFNLALVVVLALVPVYVAVTGNVFVMTLLTRALIYAIAAMSLNLIMGYGGLVSFGHAVFIGIGGYAVGIMAFHGNPNGLLQFPLAIGVSALFAAITGALCLRTRGVYFIMITLAFAQMLYFAGVGLEYYGADDGMTLKRRSYLGPFDLADRTQLYLVCLVVLLLSVWLIGRFANSRFGMVIRGAKSNETRMLALGFPVFRYRLAAYTIAGGICGLAGGLMANQAAFVSPAMMHWIQSGDLIVMVVLGGINSLMGPVYGAIAFIVVEHQLATWMKDTWQLVFGPMIVLLALFARNGLDDLFKLIAPRKDDGHG
jgi:branched-chain amino acid transport system permease protein